MKALKVVLSANRARWINEIKKNYGIKFDLILHDDFHVLYISEPGLFNNITMKMLQFQNLICYFEIWITWTANQKHEFY